LAHPTELPQLPNWTPSATAQGVFTAAECQRIIALSGERAPGGLQFAEQAGADYRSSEVSWIRPSESNTWIFSKTFDLVRKVNQRCYQMELTGFTEPLQIAEYSANGHYDWHLAVGAGPFSVRKLSFIVQLTDPTDYDGGEVEFLYAREPQTAPREQGSMTLFPSYLLHRVKPVTRGTRFSLVGWIGGPHYR
jgi:PKHD-type hydroxylase